MNSEQFYKQLTLYDLQHIVDYIQNKRELQHIQMNLRGNIKFHSKKGRKIIAGYASVAIVDNDSQFIPPEVLKKGLENLISDPHYANVMLVHKNIQVGKIIKSFEEHQTHVDESGLYIVVELREDLETSVQLWDAIIAGDFRGFSIAGEILLSHDECDDKKCIEIIDELNLFEVSICNHPVNEESGFVIVAKSNINCACGLHEPLKIIDNVCENENVINKSDKMPKKKKELKDEESTVKKEEDTKEKPKVEEKSEKEESKEPEKPKVEEKAEEPKVKEVSKEEKETPKTEEKSEEPSELDTIKTKLADLESKLADAEPIKESAKEDEDEDDEDEGDKEEEDDDEDAGKPEAEWYSAVKGKIDELLSSELPEDLKKSLDEIIGMFPKLETKNEETKPEEPEESESAKRKIDVEKTDELEPIVLKHPMPENYPFEKSEDNEPNWFEVITNAVDTMWIKLSELEKNKDYESQIDDLQLATKSKDDEIKSLRATIDKDVSDFKSRIEFLEKTETQPKTTKRESKEEKQNSGVIIKRGIIYRNY